MRKIIARLLTAQAKRLIKKSHAKVVVITGSVGKTSTTQATATILEQSFRVRKTIKNYNSDIGVPCSIFGRKIPQHLINPLPWIWMMLQNEFTLIRTPDTEVFVLELGADTGGELEQFSWLSPDMAVVTAVTPEHMENYKSIEAVAREELSVARFSEKTIINDYMVSEEFRKFAKTDELFKYSREELKNSGLELGDLHVTGVHSLDAIAAGMFVGKELGMSDSALINGAKAVRPQPGRMNLLQGIKNSVLIDDTYNSSPEAVKAALGYVKKAKFPQKIVLLGNMNELGDTSKQAHVEIGAMCDKSIDLVVTLGPDANKYTAAVAQEKGCLVATAQTPYQAAKIIKREMKDGALVLLKGSQNGVFAEEAVKLLLNDKNDEKNLVRQNAFWMRKKRNNFRRVGYAGNS